MNMCVKDIHIKFQIFHAEQNNCSDENSGNVHKFQFVNDK